MINMRGVQHNFDANETLFLARELESIEATLYEYKQKELKYRQLIPVSNRDNPGANTITYRMITKLGMAKIIANYSDDLPTVNAIVQEYTQKVKSIGTSIEYSTQDIRAAAMANVPLESIYADAARRAVHEEESSICWNGNTTYGIVGFLNNTNIPTLAAPTGTWSSATADQIIADISAAVTQIRTQSNGIHSADTMLLTISDYNRISQLPRSTNSDTTVLEFITKPGNTFGLTTVEWLANELTNAFVSGTQDGAVFYEKSSEVLEQRIPLEMVTHPVQEKNLVMKIPVEARNGGVVVRYPLACLFLTGV